MTSWFFLLVICAFVIAQPTNDLCSNAISIPGLPYTYSDTTIGAGKESTCSGTLPAGDVWFSYVPTTSIIVAISLCEGTDYDSYMKVSVEVVLLIKIRSKWSQELPITLSSVVVHFMGLMLAHTR